MQGGGMRRTGVRRLTTTRHKKMLDKSDVKINSLTVPKGNDKDF